MYFFQFSQCPLAVLSLACSHQRDSISGVLMAGPAVPKVRGHWLVSPSGQHSPEGCPGAFCAVGFLLFAVKAEHHSIVQAGLWISMGRVEQAGAVGSDVSTPLPPAMSLGGCGFTSPSEEDVLDVIPLLCGSQEGLQPWERLLCFVLCWE